MAQAHLAAVPMRGQLEPAKGVDGHCVGLYPVHVAESDPGAGLGQQGADAIAQPGKIGTGNRAANRERDHVWRWSAHRV